MALEGLMSQPRPDLTVEHPHPIMSVLAIPAVDKTIAIVASLPFCYALYHRFAQGTLSVAGAGAALGQLITIVTMVLRRAPQRVTPNPWWWLLAFVATYGALAWATLAPLGSALVPAALTTGLSLLGLAVIIYARLSLGRNIVFVAAQPTIICSVALPDVRYRIGP